MRGLSILAFFLLLSSARGGQSLQIPHTTASPKIDAVVDDPAWSAAAVISELTISNGPDGAGLEPSTTEIRLLWNENGIFIRFRCRDTKIETPFQGRDEPHFQGDAAEVFLDVAGDARSVVELQVSPANQVFDQKILLDAPPISRNGRLIDQFVMQHLKAFPNWNYEGLQTAAGRIEGGWAAVIALPPEALGLPKWKPMNVRANLLRYDWLESEPGKRSLIAMNWAPVDYGCPHLSPEAMGVLTLMPPGISKANGD